MEDLTLTYNSYGTFTLTWSYKNTGDYNIDSAVNIMDILPLAKHYNKGADDTRRWIDGNADGVIDEGDVEPIAENFFSQVWEYVVE